MHVPIAVRALAKLARLPWKATRRALLAHPYFRFDQETRDTQAHASLEHWALQNVLGINKGPYWPVHPSSRVIYWQNILAGVETSPGQMPGCYIQGIGKIYLGDYTQIGPSVGIISANHVLEDVRLHDPREVRIGAYCWLGMGAIVLPGVTLGDFTIVGAGAVVTSSFPEGYCVLAGAPARAVKPLDRAKCARHRSKHEYHGYIAAADFPEFRRKYLKV